MLLEPDLSFGGLAGKKAGMLMVDPDQASDPDDPVGARWLTVWRGACLSTQVWDQPACCRRRRRRKIMLNLLHNYSN